MRCQWGNKHPDEQCKNPATWRTGPDVERRLGGAMYVYDEHKHANDEVSAVNPYTVVLKGKE